MNLSSEKSEARRTHLPISLASSKKMLWTVIPAQPYLRIARIDSIRGDARRPVRAIQFAFRTFAEIVGSEAFLFLMIKQ